MHPVRHKPTGCLWKVLCSELEHPGDIVPELDDEADHGNRDDDRDNCNHKVQEAWHQCDNTIDNWADGSIEIESHFCYILAEHCNNPYSIPRIFKCCCVLRRETKYVF